MLLDVDQVSEEGFVLTATLAVWAGLCEGTIDLLLDACLFPGDGLSFVIDLLVPALGNTAASSTRVILVVMTLNQHLLCLCHIELALALLDD